jgi:hypothetical protein
MLMERTRARDLGTVFLAWAEEPGETARDPKRTIEEKMRTHMRLSRGGSDVFSFHANTIPAHGWLFVQAQREHQVADHRKSVASLEWDKLIHVVTGGRAKPNSGIGSWGCLLRQTKRYTMIWGRAEHGSNNATGLTALVSKPALRSVTIWVRQCSDTVLLSSLA